MRSRHARVSISPVVSPAATRFRMSRTPSMGTAAMVPVAEYPCRNPRVASRSCDMVPCERIGSARTRSVHFQIGRDERDERKAQSVGRSHQSCLDHLATVEPQLRLGRQNHFEDPGVITALLPPFHHAAAEYQRTAGNAQRQLLAELADGGIDRLLARPDAAAGPAPAAAVRMANHENAAVEPDGDDGAVVPWPADEPPQAQATVRNPQRPTRQM